MATVGCRLWQLTYRQTHSPSRLAWFEGWRPLGAVLHSSNEPGELSQWLCHDDSTINIGICIIILTLTCVLCQTSKRIVRLFSTT